MSAVLGSRTAPSWRPLVMTLVAVAVLLVLFRDTAATMVRIWAGSETFQHAFLVPPISAWLIWRKRAELAALPVRPMPWMLGPMALACVFWLVGELAVVNAASQAALVTLVVLTVPALLGPAVTRALLFPLGFLYFAVPFGEFLVPKLIDHTADFTVAALRLTGIPVFREGNDFVIPSGSWSVVAACSGVRYLIASVMVGTLFAYLNYRSLHRRLLFVGVAAVVPIVANWLRAYMIVMIGHLSDNRLAVGVDHILYGWVFFGVVIGLMFLIGARWAEPDAPPPPKPALPASLPAITRRAWAMLPAVLLMFAGTQVALLRVGAAVDPRPVVLELQDAVPEIELPFVPAWQSPAASAAARLGDGDRPVWLWIGYYRQQAAYAKLVSSVNGLLAERQRQWSQTRRGWTEVELPQGRLRLRTAEIRQAGGLAGGTVARLHVWHVYWVADRFESSDARAKLWLALDMLRGRGDDGAVVVLVTSGGDGADGALRALAERELPVLAGRLAAVRARP